MRFLMIYKPDPATLARPFTAEHMARMGAYIQKMAKSGALLDTGGTRPSVQDARIRIAGGKLTVTDGPFSEAKEVIGGYALIEAGSREEALAHAKDFLDIAGDGETHIHHVNDKPPELA